VTRRAAVHAMKKQVIHAQHERAAAKAETAEAVTGSWEKIASVIDWALAELSGKNRDAVVLRFFQDRSFSEFGWRWACPKRPPASAWPADWEGCDRSFRGAALRCRWRHWASRFQCTP
jgi:hypothetical protein